ncbi:MAG: hypothetical protein VKI81_10815, partial [Synechococcaceae cyanobacterium]|nr:hypothetical protein [Synechococcaceae cyanobacterium]
RQTGVAAFLDGNRIELFPSRDRVVRIRIPGSQLRPGRRAIRLKTGAVNASAEVVVLSRSAAGAAVLGPVAALLAVAAVATRRRARARGRSS